MSQRSSALTAISVTLAVWRLYGAKIAARCGTPAWTGAAAFVTAAILAGLPISVRMASIAEREGAMTDAVFCKECKCSHPSGWLHAKTSRGYLYTYCKLRERVRWLRKSRGITVTPEQILYVYETVQRRRCAVCNAPFLCESDANLTLKRDFRSLGDVALVHRKCRSAQSRFMGEWRQLRQVHSSGGQLRYCAKCDKVLPAGEFYQRQASCKTHYKAAETRRFRDKRIRRIHKLRRAVL